jgi:hypothetical protein
MAIIHHISHAPKSAFNKRSSLGAPIFIGDEMPPTKDMVDGEMHTSKAVLRATYKPSGNAEGASFVEVGNDPAMFRRPPETQTRPRRHQGDRGTGILPLPVRHLALSQTEERPYNR